MTMDDRELLLEGGVAGHLNHLYDNRDLTYNKIAKILSAASSGKLMGTEKTDGYNIYLGYVDGQPRAARNKGDMSRGGMTLEDLMNRTFQGGEKARTAYVSAFQAYKQAVDSFSPEQTESIFGPGGEIFYNTEIQGPVAPNVINYDENIIAIHRGGHKRFDIETNSVIDIDVGESSKALDAAIDQFEQATVDTDFRVERTAVLKLRALESDSHLKIALEKLKAVGLEGSTTIEEFLERKIAEKVDETFSYYENALKQGIIDRVMKKEGHPDLRSIYRALPKEERPKVRDFVGEGNKLLSDAIFPIEDAIHDFAVEMLRGLESIYILNNEQELNRLRAEIENAIKAIQTYTGPGQEEAQDILYKQLSKIKHHDNVSTAAEGFVFEHEGVMYKFTGNFAPMNQLLGLYKWGRGKVPAIKDWQAEADIGGEDKAPSVSPPVTRIVAVVPGAFKPPHRGHLDMVKHYSTLTDEVIVMVSTLSRKTPSGKDVTIEDALKIWDLYIKSANLANVTIKTSENASPVRAAYEFVEKDAQSGDQVMLGTSTKGGDQSRFAKSVQDYAKEGVVVLDPMEFAFDPIGEELSASDFRAALESGENLERFLPQNVDAGQIMDIFGLTEPNDEQSIGAEELYEMINQLMGERNVGVRMVDPQKQSPRKADHSRMKARITRTGPNKDDGGGEGITLAGVERPLSAPPMGERRELKETSGAAGGGALQGTPGAGSGPWLGLRDEKDSKFGTIRRPKSSEKERKSMIREEDEIVEEVMNYLLKTVASLEKKR